ncbi:unnamed protein product [Urochloa humidicola]
MSTKPRDYFAKNIWSNLATPRCKHFLWLVCRVRLPSVALLHHRCIIELPNCALCDAFEDQDHILLRCPRARHIWRLLGWPSAPFLASFADLWLLPELLDIQPASVTLAILTAILWNIWKAQNALLFRGEVLSPRSTVLAIIADLELWTHRTRKMSIKPQIIHWCDKFRDVIG